MKTKIALHCLIFMVFLTTCVGIAPYPTSLAASPTFAIPTTKTLPTLTPIPWHTPTPETLSGFPTPEPMQLPTCDKFEGCMMNLTPDVQRRDFTFHELYLGKYVLRNWCNVDSRFLSLCAVTLSSKGADKIEIWGYPARLGKETGADLTGHGRPDVVIINSSGGNCCVNTIVYEVGDSAEKIMDIWSYRVGEFTDLNGDETYEYIAPYRNFSQFCIHCTLWTSVVYEYQPDLGHYVPATYKFKDELSDEIQRALDIIAEFTKQNPNMAFHFLSTRYYDNPSADDKEFLKFEEQNSDYSRAVNMLYSLVAYYLLAGQKSDAQKTLNNYFPPDKASEYMLAIQQDLQGLLAP